MGGQPQDVILNDVKETQEHERKQKPNFGSDRRDIPKTGTCTVFAVWPLGKGSRCTVIILGNQHPTGVTRTGAICLDALLNLGDTVGYEIKNQDQMYLSSASAGTTNITIITTGAGDAVFYPTQYFSKVESGVRGVFDGS